MHDIGTHYLEDVRRQFRTLKTLADKAMAQVRDDEFFDRLDEQSNSIAILVKHLAGNNRSRWTDFLTADGEKPDRQRDTEFEIAPEDTRASLMERWEDGWARLSGTLDALRADDLGRTVRIRREPLTVVEAINRALWHHASHVGQILLLAKHLRGAAWRSLSIPRGASAAFNEKTARRHT